MHTTTTTPVYRAVCSALKPTQHGGIRMIPAGATIDHMGVCAWVKADGVALRCDCGRALRAIAITDSHRGTRERTDCGPRCYNAVGPACDCKCRGENHGAH